MMKEKTGQDTAQQRTVARLYARGLVLEYITVGYNIGEALVSIFFGSVSNSIALVGFGLDSIVESLSGMVLIWRLRKHGTMTREEEATIEKKAMKFVAITFFVLGLYVLFESVRKLVTGEQPDPSLPGIIIACASIIVMPVLAYGKYRTGKRIGSKALVADSKETSVCFVLSLALLLGLGMNQLFGLWQADPVVGVFIVFFLFREGREIWHEAHEHEE
jgi:divalent metal cation (Fe/Co/Zn/Cd) transporter